MVTSAMKVLTTDERLEWTRKDPDGFEQWYSRMLVVDTERMLKGKKIPRHRFNPDPYEP